jgi:hypothetical protein
LGVNPNGTATCSISSFSAIDTTADGHVTTWYDQSGFGNHASNLTATQQPLIVDGGTLVEENGKASVKFDNSVTYNSLEKQFASALSQPVNIFGVVQNNDTQIGFHSDMIIQVLQLMRVMV